MYEDIKISNVHGILLASEEEAEEVLRALRILLSRLGKARISDYYNLVDLANKPIFLDERWGWTDLSSAKIDRNGSYYVIKLPEPERLTTTAVVDPYA